MRKYIIAIIIVLVVAVAFVFWSRVGQPQIINNQAPTAMLLTSPSFNNNENIPAKFTCDGGNINPELQIQNVPDGAKSLALIAHDPDAPRAGGFTHWLIWNISPKTSLIKQESKPAGAVEGKNDAGDIGYMGPCPPSGTHRYFFKLYALDAMLNLPEGASEEALEGEMQKHLIEETELVGLYKR